MSYQIIYGREKPCKKISRFRHKLKSKKKVVCICCAILSLITLVYVFPGNAATIRDLFLPGDAEVTAMALENMAQSLVQGESMDAVLVTFCKEIIGGGA